MNLLIDTHTFLWYVWQDKQLSAEARRLISDKKNRIHVSTASWWEIGIKISIGKLNLGEPLDKFFPREMKKAQIAHVSIYLEHIDQYSKLPLHHRDPFDRMIVAQAMVEGFDIVSADAVLDAYPITRLW